MLEFQEDAKRTRRFRELRREPHRAFARSLPTRRLVEPLRGVAESLSPRERSTLELIGQGQSNKEIALDLSIIPETVKSHVKNIFAKLGVQRRVQAVSRAQSHGLVTTR